MITAETIDRLKGQLLTSGLSRRDQPLYQVINLLIDVARQTLGQVQTITGGGSSGGGGALGATFLTVNPEATLPNSRRLIAGVRIIFDDTVANVRTANVPINEVILTGVNELATLPNSRQLLAGVNISFDDTIANQRTINVNIAGAGYWTPLTDGNVDETDLIFAAGESIAVFVPTP